MREHFPDTKIETFRIDLSRGFSSEIADQAEQVCALAGVPFEYDKWIRPSLKTGLGNSNLIKYVGKPLTESETFYESLERLYGRAKSYDCVRVGGLYSRNRDSLLLKDGVLQANPESKRLPYLKIFWDRVEKMVLTGSAVHVVRTVDRLIEVWACAEVLRKRKKHNLNRLYLAPILVASASAEAPAMGVRIINDRWTLLSIPPVKPDDSRYSSWIDSLPLALFQSHYAQWVRQSSYEIGCQEAEALEGLMSRLFKSLKTIEKRSAHYSPIDTFTKARAFKRQMVDLAMENLWYPVLA